MFCFFQISFFIKRLVKKEKTTIIFLFWQRKIKFKPEIQSLISFILSTYLITRKVAMILRIQIEVLLIRDLLVFKILRWLLKSSL